MAIEIAISAGKVLLWAVVIFYVVPLRLFRATPRAERGSLLVRFGLALAVVAELLSLLGILDRFSFALSMILLGLGGLRVQARRPLTRLAMAAADWLHVQLYDLLDSGRASTSLLRGALARITGAARKRASCALGILRSHAGLTALLATFVVAHAALIAQDPRLVTLGQYQDLQAFKAFSAHRPWDATPQPWGAFALLYALETVSLVPADWLLRLAGILAVATAAVITYSLVLGNGRLRRPGALLAAAITLTLPTWPRSLGAGIRLSLDPGLLAGALLAVAALRPPRPQQRLPGASWQAAWRHPVAPVALLIALIHPLGWLALVAMETTRTLVRRAADPAPPPPWTQWRRVAATVAAGLPAIGLLVASALVRGVRLSAVAGLPKLHLVPGAAPPLISVLAALALLVALWKGPLLARRVPAAFGFGLLVTPGLLGKWPAAAAAVWAPILLPLGVCLAGIAVNLLLSAAWVRGRRHAVARGLLGQPRRAFL